MKSSLKENCLKVQALLSSEDKWTKGVPARTKSGQVVYSSSNDYKNAHSYCLAAACYQAITSHQVNDHNTKFSDAHQVAAVFNHLEELLPEKFEHTITHFNDHKDTKFSDVQDLLKKAVEAAGRD